MSARCPECGETHGSPCAYQLCPNRIQTPTPQFSRPDNLGGLNARPADTVTNGGGESVFIDAVNGRERGFFHGEHYGEE